MIVDYCVKPWITWEDERDDAYYPPGHFARFLVIESKGQWQVFGLRDGDSFDTPAVVSVPHAVVDQYEEAKLLKDVYALHAF